MDEQDGREDGYWDEGRYEGHRGVIWGLVGKRDRGLLAWDYIT